MKGRDAGENEKFMEREGENEGERETVSDALPPASLLLIHSLCGVGCDGIEGEGGGEEKGGFSAPLKYGITLEIIARYQRAVWLGGGNLISR